MVSQEEKVFLKELKREIERGQFGSNHSEIQRPVKKGPEQNAQR